MMLIRRGPSRQRYATASLRHRVDEAKRNLERGMARVALRQTRTDQGRDAYGKRLPRARQLTEAMSERGLRRLAERSTGPTIVVL